MPANVSTPIIWNGQGPVHIGTYDPVNGRAEQGFLTNLYSVGCGNRTLTATPSRETSTLTESCSGQRLTLKEMETAKSLQVSLSMVQFDSRTLAAAFFGEAVHREAGTVTGEVLPRLAPGDYFFTSTRACPAWWWRIPRPRPSPTCRARTTWWTTPITAAAACWRTRRRPPRCMPSR